MKNDHSSPPVCLHRERMHKAHRQFSVVRASENIKIVRSKGSRDLVPVSQSKWWVSESSLGDLRSQAGDSGFWSCQGGETPFACLGGHLEMGSRRRKGFDVDPGLQISPSQLAWCTAAFSAPLVLGLSGLESHVPPSWFPLCHCSVWV